MKNKINLIYNGGFKYLIDNNRSFLPMGISQLKAYLAKEYIIVDVLYLRIFKKNLRLLFNKFEMCKYYNIKNRFSWLLFKKNKNKN